MGERGGTCIPAAEGGRVPGIPKSQVTNTQTGKGVNEMDRWKTSGVKRWKYEMHTSLLASLLQCCETQLSHAAYTFAQLTDDRLCKCCVCPKSQPSPFTALTQKTLLHTHKYKL